MAWELWVVLAAVIAVGLIAAVKFLRSGKESGPSTGISGGGGGGSRPPYTQ